MKIMLTGGSGFIGRNIIETLAKKYEIFAPTHKELELVDQRAVDMYIKNNDIDVVIHSAVKPGHRNAKDQLNQLYTNMKMFFNLANNQDRYRKMIVIGSGLSYHFNYYKPKMKEEYIGKHIPDDEAGLSKYIISRYIEKSNNIIDLRVFGVFGKYEDYSIRFISNMICKCLFNLSLTMKQNRKFDFIYINDLIKVIEYFINNDSKHNSYNVTPDNSVELVAVAEKVRKIAKKDIPIIIKHEGMGPEYSGCNLRLKEEIKGLKFMDIDEAITDLYKWYSENINIIDKERLLVDK